MFHTRDPYYDEAGLMARGEALELLLQETEISEQEKQEALMGFLELLNNQRAAKVGVAFTERLLKRVSNAFSVHPTSDLAVDLLYGCLLVQQFHAMNFDPWRADPAIQQCSGALTALAADGRISDCFRFCQETAATYAEARFWPEALDYALRTHTYAKQLLKQKITLLENGEMLDLHDTAASVCEYALHTADGISPQIEAILQPDLGADDYTIIVREAYDTVGDMVIDPVEYTQGYLDIRAELEEKIDDALDHQRGYYDYCLDYWMAKRLILRADYGIQWKSPAALNPNVEFH